LIIGVDWKHIYRICFCTTLKISKKSCINEAFDYSFLTWNWNNKELTK